jgi:oxygen-independent coproporphyrinogen-3 oxidase
VAGIYLHIPFCKQACYYCNFHFSTSLKRKSELINAIAKELVLRKQEISSPIKTIYFGGGTPSLLDVNEMQFLIKIIYDNFNVIKNPEITLEANPDDLIDSTIFEKYRKININRLSIGIQSFFDEDLQSLNRAHSSNEAKNCLKNARQHFDNITVDLIYGIPGLTLNKWQENLQLVFDFNINHISSYALTIEPKTVLYQFIKNNKYPNADDNLALKHFQILQQETEKNGFVQYEVSNFGKPKYFSKHNTSYWLGKSYLGVGPSAHSYNKNERSWNIANNAKYIKSIVNNVLPIEKELLSTKDMFNESIMIGLRTVWGILLDKIESEFGINFLNHLLTQAQKYIKNNTLIVENNRLKATKKGLFLIDGIASDLFILN